MSTGVAAPDRIAARGLSAGGLLMGAVTHLAPTTFALVVAEAPFVDVVASMLDDTIPLTVAEWEEWGDPRDPEQFAYLLGYSPCDNLPGPRRPALLVTAARNDPRVSVHEPAKWVAKIRAAEHAAPAEKRRTAAAAHRDGRLVAHRPRRPVRRLGARGLPARRDAGPPRPHLTVSAGCWSRSAWGGPRPASRRR